MTWDEYYENEVRQGAKRAFVEGRKQGRKQGRLDTLADLVRDGILDVEAAAARADMSVDEMRRFIESGGGKGRATWRDGRTVTFA